MAVCMANHVDPDQSLHSVVSDLILHCLHRPIYPSTWVLFLYVSVSYAFLGRKRYKFNDRKFFLFKQFPATISCDITVIVMSILFLPAGQGKSYFVTVAFTGYLHIYFCNLY